MLTWFPGGPPLTYIPLPVPDTDRPWGNKECAECSGFCAGHFLTPEKLISNSKLQPVLPPSTQIQEVHLFNTNPDSSIQALAVRLLLC